MSYILCDITHNEARIAVSEDLQSFDEPKKVELVNDFKVDMKAIILAVAEMTDEEIRGMVVGLPGVCNDDRSSIIHSDEKTLSSWLEAPLQETLKKKLKTEVWLQNSTALAGLGEVLHGAGDGYVIVAYHTIGAAVDGVRIEDGVIDSVAYSFEPGQQILDIDQTILGEGAEATLENLVSSKAVKERTGEKHTDIPQSDLVWEQLAQYLAFGLRNTITYWSPDAIVLGGDMITGEPKIRIDDVVKHLHAIAGDIPVPDIVDADLGGNAALYGAMALLNQNV